MKTILIRLFIVAMVIIACVLCTSCTGNSNKEIFLIEYTVFNKNINTMGMDSVNGDKIVIRAKDKYEMQRIFDTQIAMKYDSDSISMRTRVTAIFE